jgi:hypothetical protein
VKYFGHEIKGLIHGVSKKFPWSLLETGFEANLVPGALNTPCSLVFNWISTDSGFQDELETYNMCSNSF